MAEYVLQALQWEKKCQEQAVVSFHFKMDPPNLRSFFEKSPVLMNSKGADTFIFSYLALVSFENPTEYIWQLENRPPPPTPLL